MAAKAKAANNPAAGDIQAKAAIIIARDINAPVELVWQAWTDPKHIANWWGPDGFTNTLIELTPRVGGAWRHIMHAPDGTDFPNHVIFSEVIENQRLVYASGDPAAASACQHRVTVTFEPKGTKTRVTLTMEFASEADRDETSAQGAEAAGAQTLQRLDTYAGTLLNADWMRDNSNSEDREIVTVRLVSAPRDLVWKVWTDPQHVTHWWGPVGFSTTTKSHELKSGGIWSFVMHGPDGTDYLNRVEFIDVHPPELLSYRHAGEGEHDYVKFFSTVTFDEVGPDTRITLRAVFETAALRNFVAEKHGAVEGGQQTLARFAEYVAGVPQA